MMMVRMAHFPQHLAVPVRFQHHAALKGKPAEKILLWAASVEKKCPALRQIA
jgi:hypothetical protein